MNEFVSQYPAVIIGLLSSMVAIIGVLLGALFVSFQKSIDSLAKSLTNAIDEIKLDRRLDRTSIGQLFDRMQRQETTCLETRRHCPVTFNNINGE